MSIPNWKMHEFVPDYGPGCATCGVLFEQHWSPMTNIYLVTHTSLYPRRIMQDLVDALQIQVTQHFFPAWGIDAQLRISSGNPPAGSWVLGLFDTSDQAGALGYHDLTPDGLPLGKVFAKTTLDDGQKVSVTVSHELLEMLADPDVNLSAEVDNGAGAPQAFYSYEVCDAVEADALGYGIQAPSGNHIWVSDFVYPAWFESFRPLGSTQFDYKKHLTGPFELTPGGYIGFLDITNISQGWQQLTGREGGRLSVTRSQIPDGSRREKRRKGLRRHSRYVMGSAL